MTRTPAAASSRTTVDSIVVRADGTPALVLSGHFSGRTTPQLALAGLRQVLPADVVVRGQTFIATVPLLVSRWHGPELAPRSGDYRLAGVEIAAELPAPQLIEGLTRMRFSLSEGTLVVGFGAPLTDRERGPLQQAALESDYRATTYQPLDAVFFESFYGRNASCNPLALDRAIALSHPETARYWSVADGSVQVPAGATALIEGSAEWWRIRGSARLLVVNDWLRKRYKKRRYQVVLQTWHGTMLKKLALSRSGQGLRAAIATVRESRRWDILLAQNPYSRRIFRRAYAYFGRVWEEGYPRDDRLVDGDAAAVRARLDLPEGAKVILYAPTWRDDQPDHVDHLDAARFAQKMGPGFVTLVRGHSRTLLPGEDVRGEGVIDVTGYPDVSELFLVADALVTDYSSVMFDFTVTGKPVFFFTPDLEHYRKRLRGFYFDLLAVAPGPVVSTLDDLVEKVLARESIATEFAAKYRAWRERFNPRDDGHSAERVVARLAAAGHIAG